MITGTTQVDWTVWGAMAPEPVADAWDPGGAIENTPASKASVMAFGSGPSTAGATARAVRNVSTSRAALRRGEAKRLLDRDKSARRPGGVVARHARLWGPDRRRSRAGRTPIRSCASVEASWVTPYASGNPSP